MYNLLELLSFFYFMKYVQQFRSTCTTCIYYIVYVCVWCLLFSWSHVNLCVWIMNFVIYFIFLFSVLYHLTFSSKSSNQITRINHMIIFKGTHCDKWRNTKSLHIYVLSCEYLKHYFMPPQYVYGSSVGLFVPLPR